MPDKPTLSDDDLALIQAARISGAVVRPEDLGIAIPGSAGAATAPARTGDAVKFNSQFIDKNGTLQINDGSAHNPAIAGQMMRIKSDGSIAGTLSVNEGYDAAPMLLMPPGMSKAQMVQTVTAYLEQTGAFPKNYAEKFLNDKDGAFMRSVQNFIKNQSDTDDAPYVKPILDSMRIASAQYNGASLTPAVQPAAAPATPKP